MLLPKAFRRAAAVALLGATASTSLTGACTTGAVGIAQCREIESARCEASVPCGVIEDVEECKRFYRDQCLHGIAGPAIPTNEDQSACVEAITRAGECAQGDPDGSMKACTAGGGMGGQASTEDEPTVCQFIAEPWEFEVCDFLNEKAEGGSSG